MQIHSLNRRNRPKSLAGASVVRIDNYTRVTPRMHKTGTKLARVNPGRRGFGTGITAYTPSLPLAPDLRGTVPGPSRSSVHHIEYVHTAWPLTGAERARPVADGVRR